MSHVILTEISFKLTPVILKDYYFDYLTLELDIAVIIDNIKLRY